MIHNFKLYAENFDRLARGEKQREYRLYDEKRRLINKGDTIRFIKLPDKDQELYADVLDIEVFTNWSDCYSNYFNEDFATRYHSVEEVVADTLNGYYKEEETTKYGCCVITFGNVRKKISCDSMLEEIINSCRYVSENSKHVKINYAVVDKFIADFKEPTFYLEANPFNVFDLGYEGIINFLAVYHTIGDYCFWGSPKWEIDTSVGKLDGSYAIMYLLIEYFKEHGNFDLSKKEFYNLLEGNVEIPLVNERYEQLCILNKFLNGHSFYELIKDMIDDTTLFNFLITNLPYFEDTREYTGKRVYFYKRAQLLTSDILHVRRIMEDVLTCYTNLIGCADYKIPQVMNNLGMLEYDNKLDSKISRQIPITVGSNEEIEIRANTLVVIDYIARKLNEKYPRMDINDYIWLLGQDKSRITKPYHRTLTINY